MAFISAADDLDEEDVDLDQQALLCSKAGVSFSRAQLTNESFAYGLEEFVLPKPLYIAPGYNAKQECFNVDAFEALITIEGLSHFSAFYTVAHSIKSKVTPLLPHYADDTLLPKFVMELTDGPVHTYLTIPDGVFFN
jgi:hypothetical protein